MYRKDGKLNLKKGKTTHKAGKGVEKGEGGRLEEARRVVHRTNAIKLHW